MIDTDKYEGHNTDHRIWYQYSEGITSDYTDGKSRADTADAQLIADAPKLLAEVKRLREGYKKIARDYDFNAIVSQGRNRMRPSLDVDTEHGVKVTYHQKACLRIMELFEND